MRRGLREDIRTHLLPRRFLFLLRRAWKGRKKRRSAEGREDGRRGVKEACAGQGFVFGGGGSYGSGTP